MSQDSTRDGYGYNIGGELLFCTRGIYKNYTCSVGQLYSVKTYLDKFRKDNNILPELEVYSYKFIYFRALEIRGLEIKYKIKEDSK